MEYKPLPIGYENFRQLIEDEYYYVDKTLFIKELLDNRAKVNLFTRPRRFGKTLTLSMLRYFFEDARDIKGNKQDHRHLYDGLRIMGAGERYTRHMGQYPVINLTLKSGKQPDFERSMRSLVNVIAEVFSDHRYVLESDMLPEEDRAEYYRYLRKEYEPVQYTDSLKFLSKCLRLVSGKDVIVLLDEYDVPLESAWSYGYYDEMVAFIRGLFESTLKTNDSLYFAVITGCLRISRESIFTGLNNLRINSIMTTKYGEYFGFTEEEAEQLCIYYGIPENYDQLKSWYNGYIFGDKNVYNPWSTIQYIFDHKDNPNAFPVSYWANTSSNTIVRDLIDRADRDIKDEIENLIEGGTIEKPVHEDITYAEVRDNMDNLWNFMFFTGYFKKISERFEDRKCYVTMMIPNQEVLYIFEEKIRIWFDKKLKERDPMKLFEAIAAKDTDTMALEIKKMLDTSISYHDSKEAFYHGFLLGILYGWGNYVVKSNREAGNGRYDLWLKPVSMFETAYLFEFKVAEKPGELEAKAKEALQQIYDKKYNKEVIDDGYGDTVCFGIAFCRKDCVVTVG